VSTVDPGNRPTQPHLYRTVHEDGQAGSKAIRGESIKPPDQIEVKSAPVSLVGHRGVGKPVTEDDFSRGKGRSYGIIKVLTPGRSIQEQFRQWRHGGIPGIQENGADLVGNGAPPRFAGQSYPLSQPEECFGKKLYLGGLAAPLDAFKSYEHQ
jgi:hypothetical protein